MHKLTTLLTWFDNNLIKILVVLYLILIPLYPKIPLRMIEYTYIALRFDDLFTAAVIAIYIIQVLRKKVELNRRYLMLFAAFWVAITLSFIVGYFLTHTVRPQLFQVAILNTARRFQYMIFFFIALSCVKKRGDLLFFLKIIVFCLGLVTIYGVGQKFLGFPAIQTMNPAFAKGQLLYLTPEARISSTFAGHYDLAAYLVFLLPIVLSMYFASKKYIYYAVTFLAIFALTLTASRISFGAYVASMGAFLLFTRKFKHLIIILLCTASLTFLSNNLTSRFFQTFQVKQIFVNDKTGRVVLPQNISTKELPAGSAYIPIQDDQVQVVSNATNLLVNQTVIDQVRKEASLAGETLTNAEIASRAATISSQLHAVPVVAPDISFATRIQVEWKRAILMFAKNPVSGGGASSITEATDGDYFRWLGEFGLLGTISFLVILYTILASTWQRSRHKDNLAILYLGFVFGTFGLLMNAGFIDVFEASKVAYHFWALSGIVIGSILIKPKSS